MKLFLREYGDPGSTNPTVILLHGLFGSSTNWHGIARRLGETRAVLVPDLRNHGRSGHSRVMSYPAMAEDLSGLLDDRGIDCAALVGHSMGGKVAMWLALTRPERVRALAVVDIAPEAYPHRFERLIGALSTLDLETLYGRRDADRILADQIPSPELRGFLLQNLVRDTDGWRWRLNLTVLSAAMDEIIGFPGPDARQFPGPALFVYGTASDYLAGAHLATIRALFPLARLRAVSGAGHWVYADRPHAFFKALEEFLRKS